MKLALILPITIKVLKVAFPVHKLDAINAILLLVSAVVPLMSLMSLIVLVVPTFILLVTLAL